MVFFICGACGGSFKRKQADMHTSRCYNWSFSCMDCQKDFVGSSYAEHTKCISESEKYFGDHHVAKVGRDKNEIWIEKLKHHLANAKVKPYLSRLVARMLNYPNIPRKVKPFKNFLKTNLNVTHEATVDDLWAIIETVIKAPAIEDVKGSSNKENASEKTQEIVNGNKKESSEEEPTKKKKKKRSSESSDEDEEPQREEVKESKSARRKRRKLEQCATEEPDTNICNDDVNDFADLENIGVDTVKTKSQFKWRSTLKQLLKNGPAKGTKIKKLLNQIEQLHNHPVYGASEPLPKETLNTILLKTLHKKPFTIKGDRAKKGGFATEEKDD